MRILIMQNGITTELSCPDTLAGFVWALKDHFDNIEKGSLSAIWDKAAARAAAKSAGDFKSLSNAREKKQNPLAKER